MSMIKVNQPKIPVEDENGKPVYETHEREYVIIKGKDKYIVTDNEFCHRIYNKDENIELDVYKLPSEPNSIPLIPVGTIGISLDEYLDEVVKNGGEVIDDGGDYEPDWKEWGHYFGIKDRIYRNYNILQKSCKEIGRKDIKFPDFVKDGVTPIG